MAYSASEALLHEADKDRYIAALFAPADRRDYLHALYAFDIEIARVAGRVREPMAGEIRFQWWREVILGERDGEAQANPISAALLDTLAKTGVAHATLDMLIDARARELYHDPILDRAELDTYAFETTGAMLRLSAAALSGRQEATFAEAAEPAAQAAAIVWALQTLPTHASRRQTFMPEDLLQKHGVSREDMFAGIATPSLHAAMAEMRGWARERLAAFRPHYVALDQAARPAFLHIWLLPGILDAMEQRGYDPFRTPLDVSQWRRQWRLWRAARM
ncbi:all-trans-phytoene synthase [Variibacter gotjawalensis]|uniref:All-trans-phytoene synthase n=1 Tax=Variibacter gotjawalensis TaxID=1333996 RepID=A0A0S3PWQ0_9BRAD|nr:squalene/phytoene synthase family protein [Variibacter gotjawalensis]NIK46189.1 phytoene synthase [Variibacter gotjawalensis]RZS48106.1 phytoene synthase [Variibacter gotjawalensis]BAT60363.1 all-trans-phytoene synthase [Variibacter gotjawalensis]